METGEGTHNFQALQCRVHRMNALAVRVAAQSFPATYVVFDLLRVNRVDLTASGQRVRLESRKALLSRLLDPNGRCRMVEHVEGTGIALFQECMRQGKEGVMAKERQFVVCAAFNLKKLAALLGATPYPAHPGQAAGDEGANDPLSKLRPPACRGVGRPTFLFFSDLLARLTRSVRPRPCPVPPLAQAG